jgi:shikimate kinase
MAKHRLKVLKSLVLVGMMGAGKSTIGSRLAKRLALPFVDTDILVQDKVGCSIKEILKYVGEDFFRQKETEIIREVLSREPCVISTGGGAFITDENRALIKEKSISIWLKANYDVILDRVSRRNTRPMLDDGNKEEILMQLMEERYPIYAEADIMVDSDNGSHMIIVESIINSLVDMKHKFEE